MQIQYCKLLEIGADQQVASVTDRLSAHPQKEIATNTPIRGAGLAGSAVDRRVPMDVFKKMRWLQQTLTMQREAFTS